jgi:hypothetical protein
MACFKIISCSSRDIGRIRSDINILRRCAKNMLEIMYKSISQLVRGCRMSAIRVLQVRDSIFPMSFSDGKVEESSVTVTLSSLVLLGSVEVEFLIFG